MLDIREPPRRGPRLKDDHCADDPVFKAFFVVVEGFAPDGLGISARDLSGIPTIVPTLTCSRAGMTVTVTGLLAEGPSPRFGTASCDMAASLLTRWLELP